MRDNRGVDFVIARNPEADSSLPYLLRIPLSGGDVILKVRDVWPRTTKVYCHKAESWPDNPDIVEQVAVRSCVRRGAAIELVLDRSRENKSQFVFAFARGREVVFWQSARTAKQARPMVSLPTARASSQVLEILIDSQEKYAWNFSKQQATTAKKALRVGDYAVEVDGQVVACVERKSLDDLVSTLIGGRLRSLMSALADVPNAALVIEERWSSVFKVERVRPAVIADDLASAQVRYPNVPIVFCENRALAQEWTYRFLGAARSHHLSEEAAIERTEQLRES